MLANHGQLPPHLLAPEVAAAARDVLDREELSDVSRDAIAEAKQQLAVERDAIKSGLPAHHVEEPSMLAQSGGSSLHLAALALALSSVDGRGGTAQEQIELATGRLDEIIGDLDRLKDGDTDAAERVDQLFDAIVEHVLAPIAPTA
jgi:hypothetical protein